MLHILFQFSTAILTGVRGKTISWISARAFTSFALSRNILVPRGRAPFGRHQERCAASGDEECVTQVKNNSKTIQWIKWRSYDVIGDK